MIVDLDAPYGVSDTSCDICIVGAGAAGIAIATQLLSSPFRTVVLESGGMELEPASQSLYKAEITGLPHAGVMQGRFRVCGGSTTKWGGQALPLMRSDFEPREWIPYSGWPINFDELQPFYQRASEFLMIDNRGFDDDLFRHLSAQPSAFDPRSLWYHFSKWSPKPNLRERYLPAIEQSANCTLLLHANVTHLSLSCNMNLVSSVTARSLSGRQILVKGRVVVLCAGGIEVPRLLLANHAQRENGLGNDYGLVGRFFQDHPNASVGWVRSANPSKVQRLFNVFHKRGLKYSVRCTAPSNWQREHQTLNASMGITFLQDGTVFEELRDIYSAVRTGHADKQTLRQLLHVSQHPIQTIAPIWHYVVNGRSFSPGAGMRVGITCEQEPDPESRVMLGKEIDALGMPLVNIRWKVSDLTYRTIRLFADTLRQEFRSTGLGEIYTDSWIDDTACDWRSHILDQYHHMGSTRMSNSARSGVVDRDCCVHGIANLYIGSSSVFPTSGHSNPTFTILALCIRLADHIKRFWSPRALTVSSDPKATDA